LNGAVGFYPTARALSAVLTRRAGKSGMSGGGAVGAERLRLRIGDEPQRCYAVTGAACDMLDGAYLCYA
jgi:hypothetical protein